MEENFPPTPMSELLIMEVAYHWVNVSLPPSFIIIMYQLGLVWFTKGKSIPVSFPCFFGFLLVVNFIRTGDYKILPSADPSVNDNQIVGFGYDSSIDDYKIVRIIPYYFVKAENEPGKAYCGLQVDMYSLKTNSWKIIRDLPRRDVVRHAPLIFNGEFRGRVSVSVNKSIYWLLGSKIIGFDLKNEKFKELSWPCNMQPDFHKCLKSLSVMGGYLLVHYIELDSKKFVVWKLKENDNGKEEWIKLKIASIGEAPIS
ncbi:hypothetical protein LguiA_031099 [Lonicera macranthoides]